MWHAVAVHESRSARVLRWASLAAAVAAAAVLLPPTLRDAGSFALVLLGVPVVLSAAPALLAARPVSGAPAVTWLAAMLSTGWALLLGLGVGLFLLPAAVLLLLAALAQHTQQGGPDGNLAVPRP